MMTDKELEYSYMIKDKARIYSALDVSVSLYMAY
jgi:hypothetical protein